MIRKKALLVIGTRPELIKMAMLYRQMRQEDGFDVRLCLTGQHKELLEPILALFRIKPDYVLEAMRFNTSSEQMQGYMIKAVSDVIEEFSPDLIMVQGDTNSCLAGAIAAYNNGVKIAHVEAGLRSGKPMSPYPEEGNRMLTDSMSDYHFPPTKLAEENLFAEGINNAYCTSGNTGIDALKYIIDSFRDGSIQPTDYLIRLVDEIHALNKRIIILTMHRRELQQSYLQELLVQLEELADSINSVVIYPVHPNPRFKNIIKEAEKFSNIHFIQPLIYHDFIKLLLDCNLIISDSGGIQEEASYLGKPLLIVREETERPEALSDIIELAGIDFTELASKIEKLIELKSTGSTKFGDGHASKRIIEFLKKN